MEIAATIKGLSDHQICGLVEVMLDPDHHADDKTELYVAAYKEAVRRGLYKEAK